MYAKGTSGRARFRVFTAPVLLGAVLLVVSSVHAPGVRAALDPVSKVGVRVVARPANAAHASQEFELRDGGALRTGDGLQLRLESDADAYVYVFAHGSSGKAMLLHPFSKRPEDARIRPGQLQIIPRADVFLPLDGREGRETLFTIVSPTPLEDVPDLLLRIEAKGDDVGAITAMMEAAHPGVRRLTFSHIGAKPLVGVAGIVPSAAPVRATSAPGGAGQGAQGGPGTGASPSTSPAAGWSVSATQTLGAGETRAAPTDSAAPEAAASPAASDAGPAPVSAALREAREAAGIDESAFRGILATLPDAGQAEVPSALRERYEEQGVLSAEGSRIRPLGRIELGSGAENRSQN
ncbi:MAG: DUF4384 domain-containing protein [Gammaproteobacteria bacterium]|nr:DUF4384 domain-containing protein [Gammaproteobacteria bacterium]NIP87836.1 DUF4384 domain-containing protein [Gammaproteobacteria bacterium]NIR22390.1 DUF4384 domain-containing protein [Gammaproteobacteria bacterium]NIS03962.1 DUF4384 domain-containing protein [Gammaproteobacteria bacterium]NIV45904.1 DUF4384 domain-containing protein [Gammaproteobacteria bacterium]